MLPRQKGETDMKINQYTVKYIEDEIIKDKGSLLAAAYLKLEGRDEEVLTFIMIPKVRMAVFNSCKTGWYNHSLLIDIRHKTGLIRTIRQIKQLDKNEYYINPMAKLWFDAAVRQSEQIEDPYALTERQKEDLENLMYLIIMSMSEA